MRNILAYFVYIIFFLGCDTSPAPEQSSKKPHPSGEDYFWSTCAFLNSAELDELDALQKQLISSDSITNDKDIFEKYLKLLTLAHKSDEQIVACEPSSAEQRKRLMQHFTFLGLTYGKGEFSFVNNPRLSSLFEMDYFYFPREFLEKNYTGSNYSDADKKLAAYLLGALIAMQAGVKMRDGERNTDKLISEIAKGLSTLKYGRTQVFTKLLYDIRAKLAEKITVFLQKDNSFIDNFEALRSQNIQTKIYPSFLKKDNPDWPLDYSEVIGSKTYKKEADTVFGIGSGGTPLGTGFFAKSSNNKIIFLTSGHWKYNRKISIMRQKDAEPFGSAPSESLWLQNKLDLFNFSEELVVPTLKALGFDDMQIGKITAKLGDNPYGSSFTLAQTYMPWMDAAIAVPGPAILSESDLKINDVKTLKFLAPRENFGYFAQTFGFGVTEDLASGDYNRDKSPGLRRFNEGSILFEKISVDEGAPTLDRAIFHTPLSLEHLEPFQAGVLALFSMRFDKRCSGAPFFAEGGIVGILQGPIARKGAYAGLRIVEFTPQNLALINALISDPRGLFNIPEKDLVKMVSTHIFPTQSERKNMHEILKKKYLKL